VIARHAFGDPGDRAWLEGLLWPLVAARVLEFREEVEHRDPRPAAVVVEVPLLFESGMEGVYDATIAVVAHEVVRNERARARGHAAVDERAARQLTQDEKAARATHVVHNSGTVEELERALSDVLAKLRE
jgi:dephospho-CoA kinase